MKLNKRLIILLVTIISMSLLLVACSGSKQAIPPAGQDSQGKEEKKAQLPAIISMGLKEAGTRAYANFVPIADIVSKNTEMRMDAEAIGGLGSWGPLMKRGELEFGQEEIYTTYTYFRGTREFDGQEPATYMRQVLAGYAVPLGLISRADSGIETFADLAGKPFFTDNAGTPSINVISDYLFEKYGIADKVTRLNFTKAADAAQQVIEGRAEGIFWAVEGNIANIDRAVGPIKIIPMTQEDADYVNAGLKANMFGLVPAAPPNHLGIRGKTDVPVVASRIVLITSEDVPDEVVYAVMDAIYSNQEDLVAAAPQGKEFSLETAPKAQVIPFHPGAVKFFKDKGIWTNELEAAQQEQLKTLEELKKK